MPPKKAFRLRYGVNRKVKVKQWLIWPMSKAWCNHGKASGGFKTHERVAVPRGVGDWSDKTMLCKITLNYHCYHHQQAPASEHLRTKCPTLSCELLMSMKTDVTSNASSNTKALTEARSQLNHIQNKHKLKEMLSVPLMPISECHVHGDWRSLRRRFSSLNCSRAIDL